MSSAQPNYDAEKAADRQSPERNDWDTSDKEARGSWRTRIIDSFKRDPNAHVIKPAQAANPREYDHAAAAAGTANSGLATKLKGRHLQMIAIGGSIGPSRSLT
jgi:yeast amino acid transporter